MVSWAEWRRELRPLLKLALPIVAGELGWMTMSLVDTMMVGRLSTEAMGGVSVAGILFYSVATFGIGLMFGLDTLVSQAYGAGDVRDCHKSLVNALWLTAPMAPLLMLAALGWGPVMEWSGVHPAVLREAKPYLRSLTWSMPPLLAYAALRRYLQSMSLVRPVMFAMVSANLVNAFANWVLIFGELGAPAMGSEGAGWATTVSRIYMAAVLAATAWWQDRRYGTALWEAPLRPDFARIRALAALGFPAALQIVIEVSIFALATTLISRLDPVSLAAHQVALSAASYSFMVPLGLGSAAAVRVGQLIGAQDRLGAARAGWTAISLGVTFMGCCGLLFVGAPGLVARAFSNDARVIEASAVMLALAALFQLFDGAQGVATGALRGAGNTRATAIAHGIGYWLVGLPLGYVLCFRAGWGTPGLWAGLTAALIAIGITLAFVWRKTTKEWQSAGAS
ncbi:MAG: MATE family efflux transporter [Acidobacteria bacterium]|nr:MATE family efflux transporter [Acidobacteriota bacterium]